MRGKHRLGDQRRETICRRAFSLVELLIVVAIIIVLMAMIGLVFPGFKEELDVTKCQKNLRAIHGVLTQYAAANDGWFPSFGHYYGWSVSGRYQGGGQPTITPWEALRQVAEMKEMGGSAEVFFCPFDPRYGDPDSSQFGSWEEPVCRDGVATTSVGYTFFIGRASYYYYADGRPTIRKDIGGDDDLPMAADNMHYRDEGFKAGWWHGGGAAGGGVFNSPCNTLFLGGYVIYKPWSELEEQEEGMTVGSCVDKWWFWLGHESEEY